jgi:hypothetical protein
VVTVAFLQNQWGRITPERQARINDMSVRAHTRFVDKCLFGGCASGWNITQAFVEGICDIKWQDCTRLVASRSSGSFPPDHDHIRAVLDFYRPCVVLAFGKVAEKALRRRQAEYGFRLIVGPHPTARQAGVMSEIERMAMEWADAMA